MKCTIKVVCAFIVIFVFSIFSSFDASYAQDKWQVSDKIIIVQGNDKGKLVSIYQRTPDGRSGRVAVCKIPCGKEVKLADPFFILLPPSRKELGTYIRRNSEDAVHKDGTYWFDAAPKSSLEETANYYRLYASDQNNNPKRQACLNFELKALSERTKTCFKNRPSMPPKTVRSGWCEVVFCLTSALMGQI